MVMITLQRERTSGQGHGWNRRPQEAGPGPQKGLPGLAPFPSAFPGASEHRRPSCPRMENRNAQCHLTGRPTLTPTKSHYDPLSPSPSCITHWLSISGSHVGKRHAQKCICSNPPWSGLWTSKLTGQGEGTQRPRRPGKKQETAISEAERVAGKSTGTGHLESTQATGDRSLQRGRADFSQTEGRTHPGLQES